MNTENITPEPQELSDRAFVLYDSSTNMYLSIRKLFRYREKGEYVVRFQNFGDIANVQKYCSVDEAAQKRDAAAYFNRFDRTGHNVHGRIKNALIREITTTYLVE